MSLPWLPFFIGAVIDLVKGLRRKTESYTVGSRELRFFAAAWVLTPVLFFSASGSKLPGYVLPALPGAIILTAEYIFRTMRRSRYRRVIFAAAVLTLVVTVAMVIYIVPGYAAADSVKQLVADANERGLSRQRIIGFYCVVHNAEFYAPDRLVREADGSQKNFISVSDIAAQARADADGKVLVLTPPNFVYALNETGELEASVISSNGELALVEVTAKRR
jgi:hypothetical protein